MALADAQGFDGIDETWTVGEIVEALKGEKLTAVTLTKADTALLDKHGVPYEVPKPTQRKRTITKRTTKKGGKRKR
jgi:hypothetical protein